MTVKRDLKRRVRQRQARTGESYVTARRHVVAAGSAQDDEGPTPEIDAADSDDTEAGDPASDPASDPADDAEATDGAGADRQTRAAGVEPGRQVTERDPDAEIDAGRPTAELPVAVRPEAGPQAADADADAGRPTAELAAVAGPEADRPPAGDPAAEAGAAETDAAPRTAVPVVELIDVTPRARRFGLMCHVTMHPSLAERVGPDRVLLRLRDLLVETADDPRMKALAQLGFAGHVPRHPPRPSGNLEALRAFIRRARAGLGGLFEDGSMLAFHVDGDGGTVPIQCSMHWHAAALMLWAIDDMADEFGALRDRLTVEPWFRQGPARPIGDHLPSRAVAARSGPMLFVVHAGRRHAITRDEFVIGRHSRTADLTLEDEVASRRHAAVIRRNGVYYLKDLGSTNGIYYKGMQIDNKRIDEGDVFTLGHTELRFTYLLEWTA